MKKKQTKKVVKTKKADVFMILNSTGGFVAAFRDEDEARKYQFLSIPGQDIKRIKITYNL
jgi:hypothetical protein